MVVMLGDAKKSVGIALSGCFVDTGDVMRLEEDTKPGSASETRGGAIKFTDVTKSERSAVERSETVSRIGGAFRLCDSRVLKSTFNTSRNC